MKNFQETNKLDLAASKALFLAQGLNAESENLTLSSQAVLGMQEVLRGIHDDIMIAKRGIVAEDQRDHDKH